MENTREYGRLVVNVRTAGGALPVEGATVTVYSGGDSSGEPIARLRTDRSGLTETITLAAPPRRLSMQPGEGLKPYAEYTVVTVAEGFTPVTNVNLPLYSGVLSIQPVELVPLPDASGGGYSPTVDITYGESQPPNL